MIKFARTNEELVVISGAAWNDIAAVLEWAQGISVSAPLQKLDTPGGPLIALRQSGTKEPIQVKVTGNATGGGKYTGSIWTPPTADVPTSGDLSEAELGTAGASVLILNRREVGAATHDIANSGYLPLIFEAVYLHTNADGTEVYSIDGAQHKDCTA